MNVELMEMKWQKFLAFETELKKKAQETVETTDEDTSADERDPEVEKKPSPVDVVAKGSVAKLATSSKVKVEPTKIAMNPAADTDIPAVKPKAGIVEGDPVRESTRLQGPSTQPGAVDVVEQMDGSLVDQIRL